jgi:aminoglycoside phosphotransferase (APT) family kinase protein
VQVPVPQHVGAAGFGYPFHWCLSPWIDGDPVDADSTDLGALARDLAGFVRALQGVEVADAALIGDGRRGGPLRAADADTVASAELLRGETDVDALLAAWRAGVAAPEYSGPPRWVHGDLLESNLLLRSGRLSAVIDWGGLGAGDPAVDLMIAWTLFDAPARAAYRRELGSVDEAMWLRGRAWATSAALMALPYYRDTNPAIVARFWHCVTAVLEDVRRA